MGGVGWPPATAAARQLDAVTGCVCISHQAAGSAGHFTRRPRHRPLVDVTFPTAENPTNLNITMQADKPCAVANKKDWGET